MKAHLFFILSFHIYLFLPFLAIDAYLFECVCSLILFLNVYWNFWRFKIWTNCCSFFYFSIRYVVCIRTLSCLKTKLGYNLFSTFHSTHKFGVHLNQYRIVIKISYFQAQKQQIFVNFVFLEPIISKNGRY